MEKIVLNPKEIVNEFVWDYVRDLVGGFNLRDFCLDQEVRSSVEGLELRGFDVVELFELIWTRIREDFVGFWGTLWIVRRSLEL